MIWADNKLLLFKMFLLSIYLNFLKWEFHSAFFILESPNLFCYSCLVLLYLRIFKNQINKINMTIKSIKFLSLVQTNRS